MSGPELRTIRLDEDGAVRTITLDRPDRLNAWTRRMQAEVRWAMASADADPAVRAIVITGAGRGFCAGADVKALEAIVDAGAYDTGRGSADEVPEPEPSGAPAFDHAFTSMLGMSTPVVAAINGPAAGVGFVLACFADVRFAAEGAKLTTSFARLGLPAEHGLAWLLPRLVGPAHAADLLLSGRVVLAEEAAAMGLVNRVLPPADVLPAAQQWARELAATTSPSSVRTIKRQLWGALAGDDLHRAATEAEELLDRMVTEPDFREGAAALAERRPPRFAVSTGEGA